jgi:hypothetical protein
VSPPVEAEGAPSLFAASIYRIYRDSVADSAIQSRKAARVSPADAREAGRALASSSIRRAAAPPEAPRMNSTAQVAHMAQMPNITNHFSISPIL